MFSNYKLINSALRKNKEERYQNDIANISRAVYKSTIDKDIECIRNSSVQFLEDNGFTAETVSVNDILVEKGFMSTYLFKPNLRYSAKIILIIRVHKGTHGAYINNILPLSGNKSEYEMLFNKNTKLKVLEKRRYKKRLELVVEMLQDE